MTTDTQQKDWIFFYGTFMSARVLREHGMEVDQTFAAKLNGYELSIRPRVNLKPKLGSVVYGGLALASSDAISALYDGLRRDFKIVYAQCAVVAELPDGSKRPALCFISPHIPDADPDPSYVKELAECAREMLAPEGYIKQIKDFIK